MRGQEDESMIDAWFPRSFCITEERMKMKFRGRLRPGPHQREYRHIG
jgi:hypothetical protein